MNTPTGRTKSFRLRALVVAALLPAAGMLAALPSMATPSGATTAYPTQHFIVTATTANTTGQLLTIHNGATDNTPGALLFVTPSAEPGESGTFQDWAGSNVPLGVFYEPTGTNTGNWTIFTEDDSTPIPLGMSFDVLVVHAKTSTAFYQTSKSSNTPNGADFTLINNPLTNNNPNAKLIVQDNYNPNGIISGAYNDNNVGVWYDSTAHEWSVYRESGYLTSMPLGVHFNVLVGTSSTNGGSMSVNYATAKSEGIDNYGSLVNSAATNYDPNAVAFVTHVYGAGDNDVYDNNILGVTYFTNQSVPELVVLNFNQVPIPLHSEFNILSFQS